MSRATGDTPVPTRRTMFVLPAAFTVLNLFLGYCAIAMSVKGALPDSETKAGAHYCAIGAVLVLLAAILDKLDGLVARKTNTESDFGRELDSIADVVSFGVAPALLSFAWGLNELGRIGWGASFLFLTCGSLRLARFNVQTTTTDRRFFTGLPIPMAAGVPMTLIVGHALEFPDAKDGLDPGPLPWIFLAITIAVALLMVSHFRYFAFKDVGFGRQHWPWVVLGIAGFLIALVAWTSVVLPGVALAYALHGPVLTIWRRTRGTPPVAANPS